MEVVFLYIGAIYYWFKEGKKENFWKRVFTRTEYTTKEMNDDYYAGVYIFCGLSLIIGFGLLFFRWLINDLP